MKDDAKFCPSCGASVDGKPTKPSVQAGEIKADPNDAEQGKVMAVIAYILFFIPLLTGDHKKSPFVMYHTNQGTVLFLASVALWIASSILGAILGAIRLWFIGSLLSSLVGIAILALAILGIISALNGVMKPLPVIGKFTIIK